MVDEKMSEWDREGKLMVYFNFTAWMLLLGLFLPSNEFVESSRIYEIILLLAGLSAVRFERAANE